MTPLAHGPTSMATLILEEIRDLSSHTKSMTPLAHGPVGLGSPSLISPLQAPAVVLLKVLELAAIVAPRPFVRVAVGRPDEDQQAPLLLQGVNPAKMYYA